MSNDEQDELLHLVAQGVRLHTAAEQLRISRSDVVAKLQQDSFKKLLRAAEEQAVEPVLDMLEQEAVAGNVTAAKELLAHHRDRHKGAVGRPPKDKSKGAIDAKSVAKLAGELGTSDD